MKATRAIQDLQTGPVGIRDNRPALTPASSGVTLDRPPRSVQPSRRESARSAFGEDRDAGAPFVIGSAEFGVDLSALRNVKRFGVTELEEAGGIGEQN